MKILLITDGACKGNPGVGGWAFILQAVSLAEVVKKEVCLSGSEEEITTNNRMELMAVIQGLQTLTKDGVAVWLVTDSAYVAGILAGNKAKKNKDLVNQLRLLAVKHQITVQKVQGHTGHQLNERVDQMASEAAEKAQQVLTMA